MAQALFYLPEAQLILFVARASEKPSESNWARRLSPSCLCGKKDSLIWAMKHEQPQVADSGLQAFTQMRCQALGLSSGAGGGGGHSAAPGPLPVLGATLEWSKQHLCSCPRTPVFGADW